MKILTFKGGLDFLGPFKTKSRLLEGGLDFFGPKMALAIARAI
jgi:hypothetical protein